jgi:hypothetical protein
LTHRANFIDYDIIDNRVLERIVKARPSRYADDERHATVLHNWDMNQMGLVQFGFSVCNVCGRMATQETIYGKCEGETE